MAEQQLMACREAPVRRWLVCHAFQTNAIYSHRPSDILQLMFACILECKVQFVPRILLNSSRHTDATRERQPLQPRSNVYAIAINVIFFNKNVAHVDTHAKLNPFILKYVGIARGHTALNFDSATYRIDNTAELHHMPSPAFLTTCPRCSAILGSTSVRRWSFNWTCVPSLSQPMSQLYPATSAAKMADSRRSNRSWPKAHLRRSGRILYASDCGGQGGLVHPKPLDLA